jgi:hypothetical protein
MQSGVYYQAVEEGSAPGSVPLPSAAPRSARWLAVSTCTALPVRYTLCIGMAYLTGRGVYTLLPPPKLLIVVVVIVILVVVVVVVIILLLPLPRPLPQLATAAPSTQKSEVNLSVL